MVDLSMVRCKQWRSSFSPNNMHSPNQSEAHFFEPYVEGDMAAFLRYLDVKRHNAVWGDDPEVQALCEIYDRSAEIWAYDPQVILYHLYGGVYS